MSTKSYETWAKFDVEKELERIDFNEKKEQIEKKEFKQFQEKNKVENLISNDAKVNAQILEAHAAVAALKASNKTKRKQSITQIKQEEAEKAKKILETSRLFQKKHFYLEKIMTCRRQGDLLIRKKVFQEEIKGNISRQEYQKALKMYQEALENVKALEEITPALLEIQPNDHPHPHPHDHDTCCHSTNGSDNTQQVKKTDKVSDTHTTCGHNNGCCSHQENNKNHSNTIESSFPVPNTNDLKAILKMFYMDVYMGIGICAYGLKQYADASEAFKQVLLKEEMYLSGWKWRGQVFDAMQAPLLAHLHYHRVESLEGKKNKSATTNIIEGHESSNKLENLKKLLMEESYIEREDPEYETRWFTSTNSPTQTTQELLTCCHLVMKEANVCMMEGFYLYAVRKNLIALKLLTQVEDYVEYKELQISCHLNIASCYLEMQKHYSKALDHCQKAFVLLEDDNSNTNPKRQVLIYYRLGQVYRLLRKYTQALDHLSQAKRVLCVDNNTYSHLKGIIDKEISRCTFDKTQYDVHFLKNQI
jgi:tetratricopeptide (TPR) repeat protein